MAAFLLGVSGGVGCVKSVWSLEGASEVTSRPVESGLVRILLEATLTTCGDKPGDHRPIG
jgi:hypothetical protein